VVLVKKEHYGAAEGESREYPRSPGRFQNAASALNLKSAESQQDHGKHLVLQVFEIVCEAIPPTLGAEGPEFRVAEDQEEEAAKQKAGWPCEAGRGPALTQRTFPKKEKTGKDYEESSQMMIEFTLFLILGENGLLHRALCVTVHRCGHIHALVPGVG